ncbi:MAG: PmoA family protein [Pirellulaceae bacterium]
MFSKSPRCQIVPLPGRQVAFGIDGRERLRWHAATDAPRPFFFPLIGPSGLPLTRMGHPGAPDHDHHRSIWFAHHKVLGINFWGENTDARIRQEEWLAYEDGDDSAKMACRLAWYDGHDPTALIDQQLIVSVSPDDADGVLLEIQTTLKPIADSLELNQTNFGLLAVRVAKSISARFGDGVLTGANGEQTEKKLFGKQSPWIDYSGSIDQEVTEGITYFDHKSNPTYPSKWHVRDDGWMGSSICRDAPIMLQKSEPLVLRYLLHAHAGAIHAEAANTIAKRFDGSPSFRIGPSEKPSHGKSILRNPTQKIIHE